LTQAANLTPNPQTPFAESFLRDCDGQYWFMNAVEDILNKQGKSINSLTSKTDLADITAIGLTGQSLTGHIPPAIGNISDLRFLYLAKNNLSGSLPKEIYDLTKLQNLDLSENKFSGELSSKISNWKDIKVLLLWGNNFSGRLPNEIGQLKELIRGCLKTKSGRKLA
jgi:hypothetical protein